VARLGKAKIPRVREYLARRIAVPGKLVPLLAREKDATIQRDVLRGLQAALEGWREVPMPRGWMAAYDELARSPASEVRERAVALSVLFGDRRALASLHKILVDPQARLAARRHALQTLLDKKDPELLGLLPGLLADQGMRGPAVRGLAAYQNEGTPQAIWRHYASFSDAEKIDAIQTLASRPAYHSIVGEGGEVGPELTGSQRMNLDYILENVLDPSAVVAQDYRVTILETKDGRVVTGIVKQETARAVTVQTQNEKIVLPRQEI